MVDLSIIKSGFTQKEIENQEHIISLLVEGKFNSPFKSNLIDIKKKSKETMMIIVTDGDIIENKINPPNFIFELGFDPFKNKLYPGNKDFILQSIHYLCGNKNLIKIKNNK